jgi:hypothetical protein
VVRRLRLSKIRSTRGNAALVASDRHARSSETRLLTDSPHAALGGALDTAARNGDFRWYI